MPVELSSERGTMADGDRGGWIGDEQVVLLFSSEGGVRVSRVVCFGWVRGGNVIGDVDKIDDDAGWGDDSVMGVIYQQQ